MRDHCERCGDCCRSGGPTLHKKDIALLEKGVLTRKDLFTLRKGEVVNNQILGERIPLDTEIVKVRSVAKGTACAYLDEEGASCRIYADRPVECRALECWDTDGLAAMYDRDRVTRADLSDPESGISLLAREHGEKCSITELAELAGRFVEGDEAAGEAIKELLGYDRAVRETLVQRVPESADVILFYFGRNLTDILPAFGVSVYRLGDKFTLQAGRA